MVLKRGFTLVELLIVMAILAVMTVMLVGILNPIALTGRGNDARRKKDLLRIKVSFEEYFNDEGCYPTQTYVDDNLECGFTGFSQLSPWPCDPNGGDYIVIVEDSVCPRYFRVFTKLENQKDNDIPVGWYDDVFQLYGGYNNSQVNYGVSSSNVLWYDRSCTRGGCWQKIEGICTEMTGGCIECYSSPGCEECPVSVCH